VLDFAELCEQALAPLNLNRVAPRP
jgi:hypothetical protein